MFSAVRASPPARCTISAGSSSGSSTPSSAAPRRDDLGERLVGERLELVDLRPREQRRVDLEVRVLRRRPDQRHEPVLDRRQERVLLRLVEAVDLVEEEDRALTCAPSRSRARASTPRTFGDGGRHGGELLERGPGRASPRSGRGSSCRCRAGRRRSPTDAVLLDRAPQRRALADHALLAHELLERAAAGAGGERRDVAGPLVRGIREEVAHAGSMLLAWPSRTSRSRSWRAKVQATTSATSARTSCSGCRSGLRSGRTTTSSCSRRVHQSSELWLKLAAEETELAPAHLERRELAAALRLLGRTHLSLRYVTAQLDMLERMSPWEYQEIRRVLGHGSGFDSPGFRELRRWAPALVQELHAILRERGLRPAHALRRGAGARGALPARRGADRARRARTGVAHPALPGRRARDRRPGRRHERGRPSRCSAGW